MVSANNIDSEKPPVPLQNKWCFWHDKYVPSSDNDNYESNLNVICTVNTVQEFWSAYNHLIPPDKLVTRNSLHFMKEGIKPIWEDPKNANGGAWSIRVDKDDTKTVWPEVLMLAIGEALSEALADGDELCGLSVGSRWNSDIIQIWNVNSDCASQSNIMEVVQKALPTVKFQASYYKAHKDHADYSKK